MQYGLKREEAQGPTLKSKPAFRDKNEKEIAAKETKRSGQDLGRKNEEFAAFWKASRDSISGRRGKSCKCSVAE